MTVCLFFCSFHFKAGALKPSTYFSTALQCTASIRTDLLCSNFNFSVCIQDGSTGKLLLRSWNVTVKWGNFGGNFQKSVCCGILERQWLLIFVRTILISYTRNVVHDKEFPAPWVVIHLFPTLVHKHVSPRFPADRWCSRFITAASPLLTCERQAAHAHNPSCWLFKHVFGAISIVSLPHHVKGSGTFREHKLKKRGL